MFPASLFQISSDCPNVIFILCNCRNSGPSARSQTTNNVNTVLCIGRCIFYYSEIMIYRWKYIEIKKIYSFYYLPVSIWKWIVFCIIPLFGIIIKNFSLEPKLPLKSKCNPTASDEWRVAIRSQSRHHPMGKLRWWFSFEAGSIESNFGKIISKNEKKSI